MTHLKQRNSAIIVRDVIFAIFIRELKGRFGVFRLGIGWAIIDPLAFIIMMSVFRSIMGAHSIQGIPFPVFFMLGYIPFNFFSKVQSQVSGAIKASQGLFGYRQVKPIDAILARALLESLVLFFVLIILLISFSWIGIDVQIHDPLLLITSITLLIIFGLGLGMCFCILQSRVPESEKFLDIAMRPLLFVSGVFFSLDEIPQQYRHYVDWNPILHGTEMARAACYNSFTSAGGSIYYLGFWSILIVFLGLSLYRLEWKRIVAS